MVGQHGIVSQQPVGQFLVEGGQVVEEQVLMIVHDLFLRVQLRPQAPSLDRHGGLSLQKTKTLDPFLDWIPDQSLSSARSRIGDKRRR